MKHLYEIKLDKISLIHNFNDPILAINTIHTMRSIVWEQTLIGGGVFDIIQHDFNHEGRAPTNPALYQDGYPSGR